MYINNRCLKIQVQWVYTLVIIDIFKATKIACCHTYGKRQIQVESYQNGK